MSKIKVDDFLIVPKVVTNPVPIHYIPAIPKGFKIVIDTNEQKPYKFGKIPIVNKTLNAGDYSIEGMEHLIIIERKTQSDFYGSIGNERERFNRMWNRLSYHFFLGLIIECDELDLMNPEVTYSEIDKNTVYATINSYEVKRGIHVYYGSRKACALKIANWLLVFHKNYTEKMKKNK
jgi:ERCC4-type nuclease